MKKKTAPIYFNVPFARKQLEKHGKVVTLRKMRSEGISQARSGSYSKSQIICKVRIERKSPKIENPEQLEEYVDLSGLKYDNNFHTAKDWYDLAKIMYKDEPFYAYHVECVCGVEE